MAARIFSVMLLGASNAFASPLVARYASSTESAPAASPTATGYVWNEGAVDDFTIHESCNSSQAAYLRSGLDEAMTITRQARDHILRWGNESTMYQRYFGQAPTGEPLGWFTKILMGDKAGILFRCDNIDGNCKNEGWAGHWRGSNATTETVICDLSYESRRPLEGLCMHGYDVANGPTNFYWASDLVHRLLHIPKVGEGIVEHYEGGEDYPGVLALATSDPELAVRNSDTLQYFALDVYAHDVAVPGVGCPGTYTSTADDDSHASSTTMSVLPSETSTEVPVATTTATADGGEACTPHDDHWHCPPGVPEPTSPPS